jgi:hypothetical protein
MHGQQHIKIVDSLSENVNVFSDTWRSHGCEQQYYAYVLSIRPCRQPDDEDSRFPLRGRVWNVMAQAQKTDFVFRRNGRVHLNRRGHQFSGLLAAEVCASAVVMLDTPYSEVVWRALATHSIRQFPLHFPSRGSPCAITFQLDSTLFQEAGLYSAVRLFWRTKDFLVPAKKPTSIPAVSSPYPSQNTPYATLLFLFDVSVESLNFIFRY